MDKVIELVKLGLLVSCQLHPELWKEVYINRRIQNNPYEVICTPMLLFLKLGWCIIFKNLLNECCRLWCDFLSVLMIEFKNEHHSVHFCYFIHLFKLIVQRLGAT